MGQTNNNTPFLHVGLFAAGFFFFSFFKSLHSLSFKGVMLKLILVLCLCGIAVLAKPSRLRAKTDVRQMDTEITENCADSDESAAIYTNTKYGDPSRIKVLLTFYPTANQFACKDGVGYKCLKLAEGESGLCERTCRTDTYFGYAWIMVKRDDRVTPIKCYTDRECAEQNTYTSIPCMD